MRDPYEVLGVQRNASAAEINIELCAADERIDAEIAACKAFDVFLELIHILVFHVWELDLEF